MKVVLFKSGPKRQICYVTDVTRDVSDDTGVNVSDVTAWDHVTKRDVICVALTSFSFSLLASLFEETSLFVYHAFFFLKLNFDMRIFPNMNTSCYVNDVMLSSHDVNVTRITSCFIIKLWRQKRLHPCCHWHHAWRQWHHVFFPWKIDECCF